MNVIGQGDLKYALIMNPHSGNRRARRQWERLKPEIDALLGEYALFETERADHATDLVRKALHQGYTRIVSLGGDGTHYEVVNGFFENDSPINPEASMAILPIGTACDLRKTLRLPKPKESIGYLANPNPVRMDVGRVRSMGEDGAPMTRYFLTAVHIGVGGLVAVHVNRRSKRLGGFMTFLLGVLSARAEYKCAEMTVTAGERVIKKSILEVIAANGQFDGGGMTVAPNCLLDDGQLEVFTLGEMSLVDTVLNLPRLYKGTQDKHPNCDYFRAESVDIRSNNKIWVSPDGEIAGQLNATIDLVSRGLLMVMGPNPPIA